ncbi:hypothetical protein [Nocardiopsis alkaliphila]|uniref:hypothetical protein n=1 Tax=Nocardiopsis alkaliphila TaxID=225762 RepID=UPI0003479C16|nr:hypothetical protein [Nocardiopsis alkaliphila]
MNTLLTSATVLADSFSLDKDTVTPGVLGFLAIFVLGVALFFLMRSMTGKLSVVRAEAEVEKQKTSEEGRSPAGASTAEATAEDPAAEDASGKGGTA